MKYLVLVLCVLLFACSPEPVPETVNEPQPEPAEPVAEPEPMPTPEPEPEPQLSGELRELVEKGRDTTNYKFSYSELDDGRITATYYVRGDKVRVELYTPATRESDSYDVVYLDLSNEETAAYCEQGNQIVCPNKTQKRADPDFDEYYFELPHQILERVTSGEEVGSLNYDDIQVVIIETMLDRKARMYLHSFHGIPVYIEYGEDDGIGLRDVAVGSVSEEEVTPPRW